MHEVRPGIWHWTTFRDTIGRDVSSYWIEPAGLVLDPMVPPDVGLDWWNDRPEQPQQIVLTIGLHWRDTAAFRHRFGDGPGRCAAAGLERFEGTDRDAKPFEFGDQVAPGVTALEVGGIAPDETALHIEHGGGALSIADGVIRASEGAPLSFVPDPLMGDDPASVKAGLLDSFRRLLDLEFDTLLLAHGDPIENGGREALRDFVESHS